LIEIAAIVGSQSYNNEDKSLRDRIEIISSLATLRGMRRNRSRFNAQLQINLEGVPRRPGSKRGGIFKVNSDFTKTNNAQP
jgi:hypothetical protein